MPVDAGTIESFYAARRAGDFFPAAYANKLSLDDAYAILLGVARLRSERDGERRVGWKVGLTAAAIQQQFGFHEPVFACLFGAGRIASGHRFRHSELIAPGFENELCFVLGEDVPAGASIERIAQAVARVHPAFELIETRGDFVADPALAMADNGQQKAFVIGTGVPLVGLPDLSGVLARVRINDAEVASGLGSAVLGHPLQSIRWLARKLASFGERVRAGDYVMAGSFTRQFPIAAGDRIETVFEGVGAVRAVFE